MSMSARWTCPEGNRQARRLACILDSELCLGLRMQAFGDPCPPSPAACNGLGLMDALHNDLSICSIDAAYIEILALISCTKDRSLGGSVNDVVRTWNSATVLGKTGCPRILGVPDHRGPESRTHWCWSHPIQTHFLPPTKYQTVTKRQMAADLIAEKQTAQMKAAARKTQHPQESWSS